MNSNYIYIIDTNSFIAPKNLYYPFDIAPGFWSQLALHIDNNDIVILDKVQNEIIVGNDELTNWYKEIQNKTIIDSKFLTKEYGKVLDYIQESPDKYQNAAVNKWAQANVADAWLIAAAIKNKYVIVTLEKPQAGFNDGRPKKEAKIPDVASVFGVRVINLLEMMRELKFKM